MVKKLFRLNFVRLSVLVLMFITFAGTAKAGTGDANYQVVITSDGKSHVFDVDAPEWWIVGWINHYEDELDTKRDAQRGIQYV